ncbi:MAG: protein rep [Caldibacillus thermoamylovorans]
MKKNQDIITEKIEPKKRQNEKMLNFISDYLSDKGIKLFEECSTFNLFITTKDKEKKKMVSSNSCKNRFCPVCAYRKARKDAMTLSVIMTAIKEELTYDYLFLTLTTPNVQSENLIDEINRFNKSFKKLMERNRFKKISKGYVRKLEITYNKERNDYNPHFHVVIAVNKSYFTDKDYYISQSEWLENWRQVTGLTGITENGHDEITQLSIKKVRQGNGKNSTDSAISEIAKYSAKDSDMVESPKVFDTLYKALKGRQVITFNGIFKDYKKKFENGQLDKYKEIDENQYIWKLLTEWNSTNRKFERIFEAMNDYELKKYNGLPVDELEVE